MSQRDVAELELRLREAEDTIDAIRNGAVDAIVVKSAAQHKVFTLESADYSYRQLIESMNEGAVIISSEGIILYCNERLSEMLGVSLNKVIGSSVKDYLSDDDTGAMGKLLGQSGDVDMKFETTIGPSSRRITVQISVAYMDIGNNLSALSAIVTDLSLVRRTEELSRNLQESQVLQQQKDDFIAIASHELKTPVTSIKAYTQMLQRRFTKSGDQDAAEKLSRMDGQLNKLNGLITDLLDVTKIGTGKLQLNLATFDFDRLIADTIQSMQLTSEHHTITLRGNTRQQITADKDRTEQVLVNLISNAIKYSPNSDTINVTLESDADWVTVAVQDHGIGIPEVKKERVFEQFFRVSGPEPNSFPGLGLGLYISSEIVKRLGGKIWVTSAEHQGSTFYVKIPIDTHTP